MTHRVGNKPEARRWTLRKETVSFFTEELKLICYNKQIGLLQQSQFNCRTVNSSSLLIEPESEALLLCTQTLSTFITASLKHKKDN